MSRGSLRLVVGVLAACVGLAGRPAAGQETTAPGSTPEVPAVSVGPWMDPELTGAADLVERLQAALLEAMQRAEALGYEGRRALLEPVVVATHDLGYIARVSVRKHWRGLATEDQAGFERLFRDLSVATYAARFNGYGGETFGVTGVEEPQASTALVRTVLTKAGGERVHLDYLLRFDKERGWRIANIVSNGVSDLALKQAEYAAVIDKEGFEALTQHLRRQIARCESGDAADGGS